MSDASGANGVNSAEEVLDEGLFCRDWSARDELRLLEAVEEFGAVYPMLYTNAKYAGRRLDKPSP